MDDNEVVDGDCAGVSEGETAAEDPTEEGVESVVVLHSRLCCGRAVVAAMVEA